MVAGVIGDKAQIMIQAAPIRLARLVFVHILVDKDLGAQEGMAALAKHLHLYSGWWIRHKRIIP